MENNHECGIFNWFGYILPFEERIKLIKQAGYDYAMLWWEDESYPYIINRMELVRILEYHGLKLDNVHLPFENINNLWSESGDLRKNEINIVKRWLNECRECGADTVVIHNTEGSNHKFNYKFGFDSFSNIISEADMIGINVAFENTQMVEYTDFLLREITSSKAGFCYDSSHDFVNGGSRGEILNIWKDRLLAVHLSDNDGGIYDRHWIPGKGNVNWEKIIDIIRRTNCKSYSMETYPFEGEKDMAPIDFLIKAKQSLLGLL